MNAIPNTITLEGRLRDSWESYDLASYDLYRDGQKLSNESQAVIFHGKHIRSFSDRYQVFPNEDAVILSQKIAEKIHDAELGSLKPFEAKGIGSNINPYKQCGLTKDPNQSNVYWNHNGTVVNTLYEFEKPFNPDGKDVYLGVGMGNSINGFSPFSAFSHTFRPFCKNVFMHLLKAKVILNPMTIESGDNKAGDTRGSKLSKVTRKHTRNLNEKEIIESMESVIENAFQVIEDYKNLVSEKLTQKQAEQIFAKLPKRLSNSLDTVFINKKDEIEIKGEPTQWEAFNDITHSISNGKYVKTLKGNAFNPKFESVANYMKHTQLIFNLR